MQKKSLEISCYVCGAGAFGVFFRWLQDQMAFDEAGLAERSVFNYLVPKYVEMMIYAAVVESATCEHAARRLAMENATDNASDMLGSLAQYYNRARQAEITDEIIEIVAGAEAQK